MDRLAQNNEEQNGQNQENIVYSNRNIIIATLSE